jgi:hypothetical protein
VEDGLDEAAAARLVLLLRIEPPQHTGEVTRMDAPEAAERSAATTARREKDGRTSSPRNDHRVIQSEIEATPATDVNEAAVANSTTPRPSPGTPSTRRPVERTTNVPTEAIPRRNRARA